MNSSADALTPCLTWAALPACSALCLALGAAPASAQESPYYLGAVQQVSSDSNVYRNASTVANTRDTVSSTGLRAGLDQVLGRQRLVAGLDVDLNRHARSKVLDNTDYRLNTRLDWSAAERVAGTFSAASRQGLYRYEQAATTTAYERVQRRSTDLGGQARVGLVSTLSLDGGYSASRDRYSGNTYAGLDLDQSSANLGLRLQSGGGGVLRLGLRRGSGDYVHAAATARDKVTRRDVDLSGSLTLSGLTTLDARLSRTRTAHSLNSLADGSGWTGGLGLLWQATGRLALRLGATRDGAVGATSFDQILSTGATSDTRVQNRYDLRVSWDAAELWKADAALARTRRNLAVTQAGGIAALQSDHTQELQLGLRYLPTRSLSLACRISREERTADAPTGTAVTYSYAANVVGCSAELFLR